MSERELRRIEVLSEVLAQHRVRCGSEAASINHFSMGTVSLRCKVLFIFILRFPSHFLVFLSDPMPGIQTADGETDNQQHQCPGMASWAVFVQPDAKSATPASVGTTTDQPISPVMPKPNQTPWVE